MPVFGIGLLVGACASSDDPPSGGNVDVTASPTLAGAPEWFVDPTLELADIADEVPGFVGFWFDPATGTYNVNSTDPGIDVEAVKEALIRRNPSLGESLEDVHFNVVHVNYGAAELNDWYQQVRDLIYIELPMELRPCLGFFDLDEYYNRIWVGLTCEEAREWVIQRVSEEIDAPVGAVLDHAAHAVLGPARIPLDFRQMLEQASPELFVIDFDEPLLGGPKDDRIVTPPTVRIAVRKRCVMKEGADLLQLLDDLGVGIEDALALPFGHVGRKAPLGIDGAVRIEAGLLTGVEVVRAVPRGRVHATRAVGQRHVFRENDRPLAIDKRMPILSTGKLLAFDRAELGEFGDALGREHRLDALVGQQTDAGLTVVLEADDGVFVAGMNRHAEVRGQGPRRRRPDQQINRCALGPVEQIAE